VKQVRGLRSRKERRKSGRYFAEGIRLVVEAVRSEAPIELLVVAPELLREGSGSQVAIEIGARGVPAIEVSPEVFLSLSQKDNPQGIGVVARTPDIRLEDVSPGSELCWVGLARPQDPGNVGSILRTSESVGAGGIVLLDSSVDPYDPKSVRASMGAIFTQEVIQADLDELTRWRRRHAVSMIGVTGNGDHNYRETEYRRPLLLLMGSERQGLSAEEIAACDDTVFLPMAGSSDSLNLSVATGVALYEILHRRETGVL
jgi:TrmH family RNA methyltransferase